jgi:hypothetical protein
MGERERLSNQIDELKNKLKDCFLMKEEIWPYHPSNPNFTNPISVFKMLEGEINLIEREINDLTFKINALN